MENNKDYYKETLQTIEELVLNNKYEEALAMLDEELSMPYVPSEYEIKFEDLQKEANMKLFTSSSQKVMQIPMEMIVRTFRTFNGHDLEQIHMMLVHLSELNLRKEIDQLLEVFKFENLDSWIITEVFYILVDQKIDIEIDVNGSKLNPINFVPFNEGKKLGSISSHIENNSSDSTITDASLNLLEFYLKTRFPIEPEDDKEKLYAAVFVWFANQLVNKEDIKEKLIRDWDLNESDFDELVKQIDSLNK